MDDSNEMHSDAALAIHADNAATATAAAAAVNPPALDAATPPAPPVAAAGFDTSGAWVVPVSPLPDWNAADWGELAADGGGRVTLDDAESKQQQAHGDSAGNEAAAAMEPAAAAADAAMRHDASTAVAAAPAPAVASAAAAAAFSSSITPLDLFSSDSLSGRSPNRMLDALSAVASPRLDDDGLSDMMSEGPGSLHWDDERLEHEAERRRVEEQRIEQQKKEQAKIAQADADEARQREIDAVAHEAMLKAKREREIAKEQAAAAAAAPQQKDQTTAGSPAVAAAAAAAAGKNQKQKKASSGKKKSKAAKTVLQPVRRPAEYASWDEDRRAAWNNLRKGADYYYYHFLPPGVLSTTPFVGTAWTAGERALFLHAHENYPPHGQWGLFSLHVLGRTGQECQAFYNTLRNEGALPGGPVAAEEQAKAEAEAESEAEAEAAAAAPSTTKSAGGRKSKPRTVFAPLDQESEDEESKSQAAEAAEAEAAATAAAIAAVAEAMEKSDAQDEEEEEEKSVSPPPARAARPSARRARAAKTDAGRKIKRKMDAAASSIRSFIAPEREPVVDDPTFQDAPRLLEFGSVSAPLDAHLTRAYAGAMNPADEDDQAAEDGLGEFELDSDLSSSTSDAESDDYAAAEGLIDVDTDAPAAAASAVPARRKPAKKSTKPATSRKKRPAKSSADSDDEMADFIVNDLDERSASRKAKSASSTARRKTSTAAGTNASGSSRRASRTGAIFRKAQPVRASRSDSDDADADSDDFDLEAHLSRFPAAPASPVPDANPLGLLDGGSGSQSVEDLIEAEPADSPVRGRANFVLGPSASAVASAPRRAQPIQCAQLTLHCLHLHLAHPLLPSWVPKTITCLVPPLPVESAADAVQGLAIPPSLASALNLKGVEMILPASCTIAQLRGLIEECIWDLCGVRIHLAELSGQLHAAEIPGDLLVTDVCRPLSKLAPETLHPFEIKSWSQDRINKLRLAKQGQLVPKKRIPQTMRLHQTKLVIQAMTTDRLSVSVSFDQFARVRGDHPHAFLQSVIKAGTTAGDPPGSPSSLVVEWHTTHQNRLSLQTLHESHLAPLVMALRSDTGRLHTLRLETPAFGGDCAALFVHVLTHFTASAIAPLSSLRHLYFAHSRLTSASWNLLLPSLTLLSKLEVLDLGHSSFGDESLRHLGLFLLNSKSQELHTLILDGCRELHGEPPLSSTPLSRHALLLTPSPSIRHFSFADCCFNASFLNELLSCLEDRSNLQSLNLDRLEIMRAKPVDEVARRAQHEVHGTLIELCISYSQDPSQDAQRSPLSLSIRDWFNAAPNCELEVALIELFGLDRCRLCSLDVRDCNFNPAGRMKLIDAARRMSKPLQLIFDAPATGAF